MPVASPPRLVVTGFYRYVRNPIYVGFLIILIGQTLLTGSPGMLEYTAIASCIGAAAVRFYEEPVLACKFGAEYQAYRRAVHAWVPRLHPCPSQPVRASRAHATSSGRNPIPVNFEEPHKPADGLTSGDSIVPSGSYA